MVELSCGRAQHVSMERNLGKSAATNRQRCKGEKKQKKKKTRSHSSQRERHLILVLRGLIVAKALFFQPCQTDRWAPWNVVGLSWRLNAPRPNRAPWHLARWKAYSPHPAYRNEVFGSGRLTGEIIYLLINLTVIFFGSDNMLLCFAWNWGRRRGVMIAMIPPLTSLFLELFHYLASPPVRGFYFDLKLLIF